MRQTDNASRALLITIMVIMGMVALATLCGMATLLLLRRSDSWPGALPLWRPTASPPTSTPVPTRPPASATPSRAPTRTPAPTATPTASRTPRPSSTATRSPTRTPTQTPTPLPTSTTVAATPTPFVCDDLDDLAYMELAPGQRFECTVQEETLTSLANDYGESPCSSTRITLDNGEIRVECQMFFTMSATLTARVEDCRLVLDVVSGTVGFTNVVQDLIETQFDTIRYDQICVEQVVVDDRQISVSGVGR